MPDQLSDSLAGYIDRSRVALAVSSVAGDMPLIHVNDGFCKLTGYAREEVEGRNCRFLKGTETDGASRASFHDFVRDSSRDGGRFPILNYRKDGSRFHNLVFMTRLRPATARRASSSARSST